MTASELHSWVLANVRPLAEIALDQQGEATGTEDFLIATGVHRGVLQVEGKLLELVAELIASEREAALT